jgi:hypothetical protein
MARICMERGKVECRRFLSVGSRRSSARGPHHRTWRIGPGLSEKTRRLQRLGRFQKKLAKPIRYGSICCSMEDAGMNSIIRACNQLQIWAICGELLGFQGDRVRERSINLTATCSPDPSIHELPSIPTRRSLSSRAAGRSALSLRPFGLYLA